MALCIALAVREMRMTPAEALHGATAMGAAALARDDVGVLAPGKVADLVLLDAPSYVHLAYRPGVPLVAGRLAGRPPGRARGSPVRSGCRSAVDASHFSLDYRSPAVTQLPQTPVVRRSAPRLR